MPTDNRSRKEVRIGEPAVALGIVQIGERAVGDGLVDPACHALQDLGPDALGRDGGGLELPVGLGVQVARVEGQAVFLEDV